MRGAQRATGAASLSLTHFEQAGPCPACRKQRSTGQVIQALGVTHAVLSIQIERQPSQSETAQGGEDRIRRADEDARMVPYTRALPVA
jgi:hypothetical protein